jgi:hypothetical protein
MQHREKY